MKVFEQYSMSKTGNMNDCEDQLFISDTFAAVIDGATSRYEALFNGKSSGAVAAMIVKDTLSEFKDDITLKEALDLVSIKFKHFYDSNGLDLTVCETAYERLITASVVIYCRYRKQVWMIGDCQCMIDGKLHRNLNGIDDFIAAARSLINQAELLKGKSVEWVMENDPGSEYIRVLLSEQFLFQNLTLNKEEYFKYAAIDGRKINEKMVKIINLNEDTREVILATDGYPVLCTTLKESEDALAGILVDDPLCIFKNKSVKGIRNGLVSFDDRAYLRLGI